MLNVPIVAHVTHVDYCPAARKAAACITQLALAVAVALYGPVVVTIASSTRLASVGVIILSVYPAPAAEKLVMALPPATMRSVGKLVLRVPLSLAATEPVRDTETSKGAAVSRPLYSMRRRSGKALAALKLTVTV